MNTHPLQFDGNWNEVKEKLKENNLDLTDEDLDYQPGNEDALIERLKLKMNRTREQITAWIESVAFNSSIAS